MPRAASGPDIDAVAPTDAFYPLTMPITVGPGSMAVAITLGSQRPRASLPEIALLVVAAIAGLIAIAATIYVCYRFAEGTVGALGAARHKCLSAAVGVHSALHRHRHFVERLQRPHPLAPASAASTQFWRACFACRFSFFDDT